ncbi:2Fe-2S iron-sulfur cluster-binding protein [Candidatus Enterovibrio altilux]|uniref:2Fe-2S iron-sulfur cluster-binding protein n=1 Tax=Candidatus Enterovibrio altilux TaxID=1927128 RepID=UPI001237E729|nr:2Fe-2S iron-sulfur cluster-binding protein [Candidatus Enterovibrio luxaltus]
MSQITITVNHHTFVGNTQQSLLEQMEYLGLQPEFHCRDGVCGACRCKLNGGEVMKKNALAYISVGEILTCTATPVTNVLLKFDYQLSLAEKKP